jgi:transcriptional regulator with XRE-family HTH domain
MQTLDHQNLTGPEGHVLEKAPNCARKLRKAAGLSLQHVAEAIDCSFQHLSYAERQGRRFGLDRWRALARFYGVTLDDLLNPDFEPPSFFAEKFKT